MSIAQVGLVYQDVVAGVEVINCQSVKLQVNKCYYGGDIFMVLMAAIMSLMATGHNINILFLLQVLGSVPTISVDKCLRRLHQQAGGCRFESHLSKQVIFFLMGSNILSTVYIVYH